MVPGAEASLTSETASRIAASLVEAQADLAMNQARLDSASHGQSAAADAAIAPNLLPLRKDQADLAAEVQSLSGEYGPDYPKLRDARASLAAISAEIDAETGREMNAAQADVAADEAEIATLKSALAAARTQSQTEDASSAPMRALEQRADAGRDMLRQMTLQADQLAQAASLVRPDARILSAAAQPESSSSPHRSLLLAAGGLLGLSLGVLLAALDEALDSSFRSGDAVVENTGLPCLALLPDVRDPRMIVLDAPLSVFAEQIRALRASLSLAMQDGGPRIIAITAARPGEGKTTLTIALARALAGSGMRVVAVEGDIRQPRFEPAFCSGGAKGLTDHLAGHATLDEIIERDPHSELEVIAAGAQAATCLVPVPLAGDADLAEQIAHPLRRGAAGRAARLRAGGKPRPRPLRRRRAHLHTLGQHPAPRGQRRARSPAGCRSQTPRRRVDPRGCDRARAGGVRGFGDLSAKICGVFQKLKDRHRLIHVVMLAQAGIHDLTSCRAWLRKS